MGRSLGVAAVLAVVLASCGTSPAEQAQDLVQRAGLRCDDATDLGWGLVCNGDGGPVVVGAIDDPELMREQLLLLIRPDSILRNVPVVASAAAEDDGWFLVLGEDYEPEAVADQLGGVVLRGAEEIRMHADALVGDA